MKGAQRMSRTTYLGLLLVAILVCTAALSTPRPAHAALCCDRETYTTGAYWAAKPTCAEAQAAFLALARPEAADFCGGPLKVCAINTPMCDIFPMDPLNPWEVNGVMTYSCKVACPIDH